MMQYPLSHPQQCLHGNTSQSTAYKHNTICVWLVEIAESLLK